MIRSGAVLVLLAMASCGDGADSICGPAPISESETVLAGRFVEAELELEVGSTIELSFRSTAALTYDIHVHDGDVVTNLVEGVSADETIELIAERPGQHWAMFTNATDGDIELDVDLDLGAGACWNSWL